MMIRPALLSALVAVAFAAPKELASGVVLDATNKFGIPGGHEVPVQWETTAFKDGPTLFLNGTVQEVHKQLVEINPNYNEDFKKIEPRSTDVVEKRTDSNVICSASIFGKCAVNTMFEGVNHLLRVAGRPTNGGGPGACGRVSCSFDVSIWWCNDASPVRRVMPCSCEYDADTKNSLPSQRPSTASD